MIENVRNALSPDCGMALERSNAVLFPFQQFSRLAASLAFCLALSADSWALTKSERIASGRACLKDCHNSGKKPPEMIRCEVACCKQYKLLKPPSRCEAAAMVNPGQPDSSQGGGVLEQ